VEPQNGFLLPEIQTCTRNRVAKPRKQNPKAVKQALVPFQERALHGVVNWNRVDGGLYVGRGALDCSIVD